MPTDASVGGAGVGDQPVGGFGPGEGGATVAIPSCQDSDDILSELLLRMGNRQDIRNRAKVWIDQAYRVITKKYRFREFEIVSTVLTATQIGVDEYSFPSDATLIRSIRDLTNRRSLMDKDWTDLERMSPTSGRPCMWARHGYTIILRPVPDGVFQLRTRIKAAAAPLLFPGNHSERLYIPCEWSEGVLRLAKAFAHGALVGEELESDQAMTLYRQFLTDAVEVEVEEDRDLEQTLSPRTE